MDRKKLEKLCLIIRHDILTSTSVAGSGHPTSSLSAVELATTLFFGGFFQKNDRFILSKGHAAPLLYSLYHANGSISENELLTLRKFGSRLEGHPTPRFPGVDVATGSLGQGLSVGIGMALGIKLLRKTFKVWVMLGDSEMAEGQIWEAIQIASHYKLENLVGIIDVNRLGQNGQTMLGWNVEEYSRRISSFGWKTIIIKDGHNLEAVYQGFKEISSQKPTMLIARTVKGKGVPFLENKEGWHGKVYEK